MVDSTPTAQRPASITMSMRPRRSVSTWAALVGETWPERLAEGATTGPSNALSKACATGCAGTRTAMLSSPASARSATPQSGRFGSTSVSGPGQNAAASRAAAASNWASRLRRLDVRDMGDQRIEGRPALGGVEAGDGLAVARVGAEPIDGLGRKRDQPALAKAGGCGLDRLRRRPLTPAFPARRSSFLSSLRL